MINVARNTKFKKELKKHQKILKLYAKEKGDTEAIEILNAKVPE